MLTLELKSQHLKCSPPTNCIYFKRIHVKVALKVFPCLLPSHLDPINLQRILHPHATSQWQGSSMQHPESARVSLLPLPALAPITDATSTENV